MEGPTNRARAYSYLRFSRPEQMDGDSLRRQTEAAAAYADRNGLDLDADLTFRDLGLSAAAGANAAVGALGQFIQAVDSGKVAPGSYLLVEKMDRLSRDDVRLARDRFESLLDKGIVIVTLNPEQVFRADNYDLTKMIIALIDMSSSRAFSENLSHRVGEAWANKRRRAAKDGHKLTARCPAWLRLKDGSFRVIEERAAVVRRIFELTLAGWGKSSIARRLNEEGVVPFGRADGWHPSYVQKILRSEAVIGRYQPMKRANKFERARVPDGEPIEGYFPAVIDPADFYRVKQSKPGPSGRKDALPQNLLYEVAYCARCGGKMHYVNKGPSPKGGTYLACDNARRKGGCDAKSVRYQPVFRYVVDHLPQMRSLYEVAQRNRPDADAEIETVRAQIAEGEETIARLLDTLERVQSASVERRISEHEERLATLRERLRELEERKAAGREKAAASQDEIEAYYAWWDSPSERGDEGETAVAHIGAEIRRLVEKVIVEKDKPTRMVARDGTEITPDSPTASGQYLRELVEEIGAVLARRPEPHVEVSDNRLRIVSEDGAGVDWQLGDPLYERVVRVNGLLDHWTPGTEEPRLYKRKGVLRLGRTTRAARAKVATPSRRSI